MKADKGRGHTLPFPFSISAPFKPPGDFRFQACKTLKGGSPKSHEQKISKRH
ncbi:hypothetical protein CHCC14820_2169 [Bacillus paralicheniformis]|nr:hypothetical protein CHCC14821_0539 [Bacillus paralicheniformis]TWM28843.1 hypothetical protein CHCC14820_2169 [Bacillus paralicheniformis]